MPGIIDELGQAGSSMRCAELQGHLEALGFAVRTGRKTGHRIVTHRKLAGFTSTSFSCGHGKNSQIKPAYIRNIRRVLEIYRSEIEDFLEAVKS